MEAIVVLLMKGIKSASSCTYDVHMKFQENPSIRSKLLRETYKDGSANVVSYDCSAYEARNKINMSMILQGNNH
jgi:hypothetical protein